MQRLLGVAVATAAIAIGALGPATATGTGHDGCTPGYWKNHTSNWEEAAPDQLVGSIFQVSSALSDVTLRDALAQPGGSGLAGAERILIRAATAAWLNAAHDDVGYPWRRHAAGLDGRPPLAKYVNTALASGDRATMLAAANRLDSDNNLGCPL